jgi:hypothetical protein
VTRKKNPGREYLLVEKRDERRDTKDEEEKSRQGLSVGRKERHIKYKDYA